MPFELHNPRKRAVECVLRGSFGTRTILGESFVPDPEQEERGLSAEFFEDYVPKFLKPTPPVVRRRLLEASGLEVSVMFLEATCHLEEFGGLDQFVVPASVDSVETSPARGGNKTEATVHRYINQGDTLAESQESLPVERESEEVRRKYLGR